MKLSSFTGRNKLFVNLTMIAMSVGLVIGLQALRGSSTNDAGSLLVPNALAASPSPSPTPSPSPSPSSNGCSPGYFKNHQSTWVGTCCGNEGQRSCDDLLTALTCRGSDASCGRSDAAAYLNACTGCTE